MNTNLVSRTGLVPEQMIPQSSPADALETTVERVLVAVRPSNLADPLAGTRHAEESLRDALRRVDAGSDPALAQAVACAEAACEHLRYGELQEARLLLVAARGRLARSHAGSA
ncbi:hypothetical protein [Saccharothrix sp. HUAS TT1]|uniref:hypothetical protein n=1 Tax=unclassified Saccharothrix TaxID=2593673 RepID=UPI00345B9A28